MICPKCGYSNAAGEKLCKQCGAPLVEPASDPTAKPSSNPQGEAKKLPFFMRMWVIIVLFLTGYGAIPALILFVLRLKKYPDQRQGAWKGLGIVAAVSVISIVAAFLIGNEGTQSATVDSASRESTAQKDSTAQEAKTEEDKPQAEQAASDEPLPEYDYPDVFDLDDIEYVLVTENLTRDEYKIGDSRLRYVTECGIVEGCKGSAEEIRIPAKIGLTVIIGISPNTCMPQSLFWPSNLRKIELPDTLREIGGGAFADCALLEEINIPRGVSVIRGSTFNGCESLKAISLPDTVTEIGDLAFAGCSSLKSVTLPNQLERIGACAFLDCESLTRLDIPASVKEIGSDALEMHRSSDEPVHIYYAGTQTQWLEITFLQDSNETSPGLEQCIIHFSDGSEMSYADSYNLAKWEEGIKEVYDLGEGKLAIEYDRYTGIIDTDGKLLFFTESNSPLSYDAGYYCTTVNDSVVVLNQKGERVASTPLYGGDYEHGAEILAYGAGYYFVENYTSGFDGKRYLFSVTDTSGNSIAFTDVDTGEIVEILESTEPLSARYIGKGVFTCADSTGSTFFFFTKTGKVISNQRAGLMEGYAFNRFDEGDDLFAYYVGSDGSQAILSYCDSKGNYKDVAIPKEFGNSPRLVGASKGVFFLLSDFEAAARNTYFSYTVKTGAFTAYSGQYTEQVSPTFSIWNPNHTGSGSGCFAIPLKGKDGGSYAVIVNNKMEEICEPIRCDSGCFFAGELFCDGTVESTFYRVDGNEVTPLCRIDRRCAVAENASFRSSTNDCVYINGGMFFVPDYGAFLKVPKTTGDPELVEIDQRNASKINLY